MLTPSDGLYNASDTTPTSSTLSSLPGLINSDYTDDPSSYWTGGKSYGLDLGSAKSVTSLVVYSSIYGSGEMNASWDDLEVYSSSDNSSWTLVDTLEGSVDCSVVQESDHCHFEVEFPETSARYFKVYSPSGIAFGAGGTSAKVSELEAYYAAASLPSFFNKIKVRTAINGAPNFGGV